MTKIVGIDFGTSNVRITQWDGDTDSQSQSCDISEIGDTHVMPAVVAIQRTDGGVQILVGDNADVLRDIEDVQVVVRNVKRWALVRDKHVREHLRWSLEQRNAEEGSGNPEWLDEDTLSIRALGKDSDN